MPANEMGLLVLEEIPGWQHIGDESWEQISIDNVSPHDSPRLESPQHYSPGAFRINESRDNHDFYIKTNAMAHGLDKTRPTGGIRLLSRNPSSSKTSLP